MKYYVEMRVDARMEIEVEAGSVAEAEQLAFAKYLDADLGAISDVENEEVVCISDAEGNILK